MPNPNKAGYEKPSRAISEVITYPLSVYQGLSPETSRRRREKKRAKSGSGGYLWQSKDQKHLRTGTAVHLLGQGCPLLVSHKYVCNNILRARRTQRGFWPVWSVWAILSDTAPQYQLLAPLCACEKIHTDADRFVNAFTDLT
jgi:hypothetical protein